MKNSLVKKITEGAKQVGKKVLDTGKRYALPIIASGIVSYAATQNANAQEESNVFSYENQNTGASIEKDKIRVKDGKDLEIKMIKGRGEYFQNIPLTIKGFPTNPKKISNADLANTFKDTLNLVSFYKETAQYDLDAYTKGFLEVSSKEPYQWVKAKDANGNHLNVIPLSLKRNLKTGKPEIYAEILCDSQLNKKNGITDKNTSYIAKENLENILKQLTDNLSTLNLNRKINGQTIKTNFYFPSASDSTVYFIPNIEDYTKLRILPATKDEKGVTSRIRQVAIVSPIGVYEKVRIDGEVSIDNVSISKISGTAVDGYADESITSNQKTSEEKQDSTKKKNLYLIFGANASPDFKFVEGQFGVQYGPIALVANYGLGKDERVKEITTATSPNTGRYGYGTEDNTNLKVLGLSAELHGFSNRKISPFIGGGINKWDYTTEISEQIKNTNGDVLKTIFNSKANSELSYKAIAGLNVKLGKNLKLGLQAGYDTKTKLNAGARCSLKF